MANDNYRLRLALRVGGTWHRDLDSAPQQDPRLRVRAMLERLKHLAQQAATESQGFYDDDAPAILRAISPLAEGADRMFADEALRLGYELECPLPFECHEYQDDIKNEVSRHEFSKLLAKATAVFELDGSRGDKPAAYETVGYMVLDQCDILMAIWDGTPAKGAGGSADIVGEALRRGIPVVRLDPKSEKLDTILTPGGSDSGDRNGWGGIDERPKDTVWRLLLPPLFPDPTGSLHVTERLLARVLGGVWRVFEWALTLRVRRSNRPADFPPESHSTFAFRTQYAGWDRSAQLLSGLYRGAFLLNYVLGGLAVFLAIVGNARSDWFWPPVCESILIAIVITLMLLLRWRRWHLRTADCRYLAEQFRVLCYSYPLGLARCEPHSTNSAQLGDMWLEWHTRAIVRLTPMPTAKVTEWYLEEHVKATPQMGARADSLSHPQRGQVGKNRVSALRVVLGVHPGGLLCCARDLLLARRRSGACSGVAAVVLYCGFAGGIGGSPRHFHARRVPEASGAVGVDGWAG